MHSTQEIVYQDRSWWVILQNPLIKVEGLRYSFTWESFAIAYGRIIVLLYITIIVFNWPVWLGRLFMHMLSCLHTLVQFLHSLIFFILLLFSCIVTCLLAWDTHTCMQIMAHILCMYTPPHIDYIIYIYYCRALVGEQHAWLCIYVMCCNCVA